jgi:hypothetical protein
MTIPETPKWTDLWIIAGDMLNCSECRAPQFMIQGDSDFIHEPGCSRVGPGQKPYMELLAMLKGAERSQR